MRSPDPDYEDPDYEEDPQYATDRLEEARSEPDVTLLYLDECGYEKIPSLDRGYEAKGGTNRPLPPHKAPASRCALRPA